MTKQKFVPRHLYANYVKKAMQSYESMEMQFQRQYWDACVGSAVHATISIVDAIAVQQLGRRSSSQNHYETVLLLNEIKTSDENRKANLKADIAGIMEMKTPAEYSEKMMSRADAERAMAKCKRIYSFIMEEIQKQEKAIS